jgi:DNA-binding NtrC family response regulator
MEKILLIIFDPSLRQLYHELLSTSDYEVIPADSIENALLSLMGNRISIVAIYVDDDNREEAEMFLKLCRYRQIWMDLRFAVISSQLINYPYNSMLDLKLNPDILEADEIASIIRNAL